MSKEKMSLELLESIRLEFYRFSEKLEAAHTRMNEESNETFPRTVTKETAALRRAALDLKNELTRITQSRSY